MNIWKMSTIALAVSLGVVVGQGAVQRADAENQPRMEDELAKLREARGWLERAADDKGGHRVKAIALTQQAIDETKAGVDYANAHH